MAHPGWDKNPHRNKPGTMTRLAVIIVLVILAVLVAIALFNALH